MIQHENFDSVKLGDLVKYNTGGWHNRTVIGKVTKVTAAQFAVGADRFRKSDGKQIGENYIYCNHATADELEQQQAALRKRQLANSIIRWFDNSDNVEGLTVAQLQAIKSIITSQDKKQ